MSNTEGLSGLNGKPPVISSATPSGIGAPPPARPDLRSAQREEARLPSRDDPRFKRRFKSTDDRFSIPKEYWPPGWTWEWKRCLVGGKEESYYLSELQMNSWEPVLAENLDPMVLRSIAPLGQKSGPIIKSDQMLHQRP